MISRSMRNTSSKTAASCTASLTYILISLLSGCTKLIDNKYETEASGGITIETVADYAKTNVDYISMGALTHSVKSLDLSLKAF